MDNAKEIIVYLNSRFKTNKLTLNLNKTNFIIFTSENKRANIDIPDTLQIDNIIVNRITHTKYLGLIID